MMKGETTLMDRLIIFFGGFFYGVVVGVFVGIFAVSFVYSPAPGGKIYTERME